MDASWIPVLAVFPLGFSVLFWGEPFAIHLGERINATAAVVAILALLVAGLSPLFLIAGQSSAKWGLLSYGLGAALGRFGLERSQSKSE